MSARFPETPELAIWQRAIQPGKGGLSEAAAEALLGMRLGKKDLDRADRLAAKSVKGTLSDSELQELEGYRNVSTVLEFLKSKARRSLSAVR